MFPDPNDAVDKWVMATLYAQQRFAAGVGAGDLLDAINEIRDLPVTTDCPASELTGD